jgi:uncharacterized damage-inducible protein DinB
MRQIARTLGLTILVLVVTASRPFAQSVSLQAEMLKDWSDLKATMDKIAAEMPEDKYGFKSTPAQRSYAEQVLHIALVNARFFTMLGGKAPVPTIDPKTTGKAAVIKAMDDTFDYGTAYLKGQTDQTLLQAVEKPPGFLGPSTHARLFTFLIGHTWDIYGQMAVYLRLNGGVPPASQRP